MTINFKNDDSFFTVVMPIRTPIKFWDFYKWVDLEDSARFRFIRDLEIEQDRLTAREVEEIYPGVKTIGVVTNPWARVAWSYEMTVNRPHEGYPGVKEIESKFKGIDFTSFESYVESMKDCKVLNANYHPTMPQAHWLENDGKSVDFLIRSENLNDDFEAVQDYFCTERPLNVDDFYFDYKPYYNEKTKKTVEDLLRYDIETYGYSF